MKAPVEFWLYEGDHEDQIFRSDPELNNTIHVIEKSAYDKQAKRIKELEEKNSAIQKMLDAVLS